MCVCVCVCACVCVYGYLFSESISLMLVSVQDQILIVASSVRLGGLHTHREADRQRKMLHVGHAYIVGIHILY